jgi:uracil-DNA glycosylase
MPPLPLLSSYGRHKARWINCTRCSLCEKRNKVCLARGTIPCDVLFLGEAPGVSEDVLGSPFVGPAGHLLDRIIEESIPDEVDYALTNLVACIPKDEDNDKVGEPPEEAINACAPRLKEFVRICRPNRVILVGTLAHKHFKEDVPTVKILHPAAILRLDVSQRGLAIQRSIVAIIHSGLV